MIAAPVCGAFHMARHCTKGLLYVFHDFNAQMCGYHYLHRKNRGSGNPTRIPQCWGLRFEDCAITPFTLYHGSLHLFLLLDLCVLCRVRSLSPPPHFSGVGGLNIWLRSREQIVLNPLFIDVFLKRSIPVVLSPRCMTRFSVCLVLAFALHACRNVWSRRSLSVGCVVALWHLATELWSSSGRLRTQRLLAMAAVKMYVKVKRKRDFEMG